MRYSAALNGDLAALPDVVTLVQQV